MNLVASNPILKARRTIHPNTVLDPLKNKTPILKSVGDNAKIGKGSQHIVKGKWRGMPMYSLTLQERATCPSDCLHWRDCYGNAMGYAHRFEHGPKLEKRLTTEIRYLATIHKYGFVVRLHVLGDFYSVRYVRFWESMLMLYPNLHVFGYTARHKGPIHEALIKIRVNLPERWWIRISRNDNTANTLYANTVPSVMSIPCPEQSGKTQSCLTCGLCWATTKAIEFQSHDILAKKRKEITCSL